MTNEDRPARANERGEAMLKSVIKFAAETLAVMAPVTMGCAALWLAPALVTLGAAAGGAFLSMVVMVELDEDAI
jgi:hypothetical protein